MNPSRTIAAAVIGNALEWYDFILYALFAPTIAATYFPRHNPMDSLLLAVATFGAGFVLRPIGALVLGRYADRRGRRPAMSVIIGLMTLATALLAFTPSYRQIGLAAPLLIVASRLLQGFSVGGELGSSTALLIESAPPNRRYVYASLQASSQSVSSLAAALAGSIAAGLLTPAQLGSWGWRVPFMAGLLIGPVGLYIRSRLPEPDGTHPAATPLGDLWRHHRTDVLRCVGLISLGTMCTYILTLTMPAYAQRELGISPGDTFAADIVANLVAIVAAPVFGRLADRIGPRALMLPAAIVMGICVYPAYRLLTVFPTTAMLITIQSGLLFIVAMMTGPVYGLIGSLFPPEVRSSGMSIGYNISVLLFGGFAPFVTTWLIKTTGDKHMPGLYVTAGAVFTLAALLIRWPQGRALPEPFAQPAE